MKNRKAFFLTWIMAGSLVLSAYAQPGSLDIGQLLDLPAAKLLPPGEVGTELRLYPNGGLFAGLSVGLSDRFGMGAGFGGENIIGIGKVRLNPQPSVRIEYLLFEERFLSPALLLGFNLEFTSGSIRDWYCSANTMPPSMTIAIMRSDRVKDI